MRSKREVHIHKRELSLNQYIKRPHYTRVTCSTKTLTVNPLVKGSVIINSVGICSSIVQEH